MKCNMWLGLGTVKGDPQITGEGDRKQAFFNFETIRRMQQANGQWVDTPTLVPIYALANKVKVVQDYCSDGRQLFLTCYYNNWDAGNGQIGHGMVVQTVELGYQPKKEYQEQAAPAGGPGGPM